MSLSGSSFVYLARAEHCTTPRTATPRDVMTRDARAGNRHVGRIGVLAEHTEVIRKCVTVVRSIHIAGVASDTVHSKPIRFWLQPAV